MRAAGAENLHNFKMQAIIPYDLRVSKLKSAFKISLLIHCANKSLSTLQTVNERRPTRAIF